jgi:hypothetical protein
MFFIGSLNGVDCSAIEETASSDRCTREILLRVYHNRNLKSVKLALIADKIRVNVWMALKKRRGSDAKKINRQVRAHPARLAQASTSSSGQVFITSAAVTQPRRAVATP